ncbi:outer membrane protein assembly factor BamD [Buchnera aphidicola (Hyperomyzus lactucae)]|uniref:Outer membrane protein assembly factor BamD n=1 Tax=Buchnera aphidicola (Hyperomyzus lactucae) TaxID=1241860 RepID=A0A4D6Y3X2_9GAMM|nr:outer membrane protein assembly factor BamD [Buchnera aphidicola]QCI21118.1 outer membrane protein assembly factor BamD [Buchnera aphidicola (Hyperomyzus lactucae)]
MKIQKNIIFIFIFTILFFNLTVHSETLNKNVFIEKYILYKKSRKELREKRFDNAIYILENMKKNNTNYLENDRIQINLIYAYYKNLNFNLAQKNIKEFIYFYPNHPNMDYVIYIRCLISMILDKNIFFKCLPISYHKNDPHYAINAFFQLKKFIYQYPKSFYVINAKRNLIYLKNRLAEHDFEILKFYFLHKQYISVVNRGAEIIRKYSETLTARKTLIYMEKSFFALKIFDTSKKISEIIALNKI